jgi:hypothetical protein
MSRRRRMMLSTSLIDAGGLRNESAKAFLHARKGLQENGPFSPCSGVQEEALAGTSPCGPPSVPSYVVLAGVEFDENSDRSAGRQVNVAISDPLRRPAESLLSGSVCWDTERRGYAG